MGEAGEQEAPSPDQLLPTTTAAPETSALDTSTTIPPTSAIEDLVETDPGLEGAAAALPATALPAAGDVPDVADDPDIAGVEGAVDNNLFDDGTFDDLTNMDGDAGADDDDDDALLDFDGGMGMEDSAFGDAMHGMDTHTPMGPGEGEEGR